MKVLLVVGHEFGKTTLLEAIKKEHGDSVVMITPEEAMETKSMEKGLAPNDFENSFPIHARHELPEVVAPFYDTGRTGKGGRARNRSKYGKR